MIFPALLAALLVAPAAHAVEGFCIFPPALQPALDEAIQFKQGCGETLARFDKTGTGSKIVISDYTKTPAMMYVFDSAGSQCINMEKVDYGNGAGRTSPKPACSASSKLTPPGFHVTAEDHTSAKYPPPKSILLVGLQGQNSAGRHILIHHAIGNGGCHTWGCSGIGNYKEIRAELAGGSLVYNYFGEAGKNAPGCGATAHQQCQADSYQHSGANPTRARSGRQTR